MGYENYTNKIMIEASKIKSLNIFLKIAEIEIDKINVTSTKTEVTLQQTPSSISIVTSDEIRKRTFRHLIMYTNRCRE